MSSLFSYLFLGWRVFIFSDWHSQGESANGNFGLVVLS